jgi:hypothetical protein
VTVWKVRFPDAPGGMQDFEMESAELEEAIKLYKLQPLGNFQLQNDDESL